MHSFANPLVPGVTSTVRTFAPPASACYRLIVLTGLLLCSWLACQAQDTIVKVDKTRIESKIVEITDDVVRYKRFDFQDGPLYTIRKSEVFMIVYKNGRTESFDAPAPVSATAAKQPTRPEAPAKQPTRPATFAPTSPASPDSPTSPPAGADEPGGAKANSLKNPFRLMGSAGVCDRINALTFMGALEVMGANKKIAFLSKFTNAGLGMAGNSLVGLSHDAEDGERLVYNKHYLSAYAFKEFDGRLGTAGLLLGPSLNYTNATLYVYPDSSKPSQDISTGFLAAGVHTGQYVQKYLWTNGNGQKTGFLRLGLNQFFMLKGAFATSFLITIGI